MVAYSFWAAHPSDGPSGLLTTYAKGAVNSQCRRAISNSGESVDGFWLVVQCAERGGDVGVSGQAPGFAGQVPQACHDVCSVSGSHL